MNYSFKSMSSSYLLMSALLLKQRTWPFILFVSALCSSILQTPCKNAQDSPLLVCHALNPKPYPKLNQHNECQRMIVNYEEKL